MIHRSLLIRVFVACGLLVNAATAQAGNESWVSGTGARHGQLPENRAMPDLSIRA